MFDRDVDHNFRDPATIAERLQLELTDQRELVNRRVADLRRVLENGASWHHPHAVTARSRLVGAMNDLRTLELLLLDAPSAPLNAPVKLTTRRGRP